MKTLLPTKRFSEIRIPWWENPFNWIIIELFIFLFIMVGLQIWEIYKLNWG